MSKIISLAKAAQISKNAKKMGTNVVFTSGCFDILHLGHIRFLQAAKSFAGLNGLLMVGVDTDEYLKMTKGKGHPFFSQMTRAEILASLLYVNYVIKFRGSRKTHSDFVSLYRKISPNWVVFGNTEPATLEKIKKQVEEVGSKFKTIQNNRKLDSSSRIIDRISK